MCVVWEDPRYSGQSRYIAKPNNPTNGFLTPCVRGINIFWFVLTKIKNRK